MYWTDRSTASRWTWWLIAAVIFVGALSVLLALQANEREARGRAAVAQEFANWMVVPPTDAPRQAKTTSLFRDRPDALAEVTNEISRELIAALQPIYDIAPRRAEQIRRALNGMTSDGVAAVLGGGRSLHRASVIATDIAVDQKRQADRAQRLSAVGSVAALFVAMLLVVLLLLRERRVMLTGARRHAEQIQDLADRDGLTGVLNRRRFDEDLGHLSDPTSGAVEIVVCDINGLKRINDRLGHSAGDSVIQTVANHMLRAVGPGGAVYRTGGDEFSILSEVGCRVADDVRDALENDGVILASVGVATWPSDGGWPRDVVRLADNRMYDAKRAIAATAS